MASKSSYHQIPRDSIDSERDENEFLISSPHSGLIDAPSPSDGWSRGVSIGTLLRIASGSCAISGFVVAVIFEPASFIPADVFMMVIFLYNLFMLIPRCAPCPISLSLDYEGRDLLKFRKGTFKKKLYLSSFVDLALSIALFTSMTIAMVDFDRWYRWRSNPVATGVLGYLVSVIQAVIAIPPIHSVSFVLRKVNRPDAQSRQTSYRAQRPGKQVSMTAAVEEIAAPPDLV